MITNREVRRIVSHPHAGGSTVSSRIAYDGRGEPIAWAVHVYPRGTPIAVSASAAGLTVCDVLGHLKLHGADGCPACGAP